MEEDPKAAAVINKWAREKERLEASAQAAEKNFQKTFADLLRQDEVKRSLALDAQAATKDQSRRESSSDIAVLRNRSAQRGYVSDEIITGNEPLPWDQ